MKFDKMIQTIYIYFKIQRIKTFLEVGKSGELIPVFVNSVFL